MNKMTSKQALCDLYFLAIGNQQYTLECKEKIQKDLEVLEMLKNKVCFIEKINPKFWLDKDVYNETCNYDYYKWVVKEYDYSVKEEKQLTQEEFNLLKEWLEE